MTQPGISTRLLPPTATCKFPPTLGLLASQGGPTAVATAFLWAERGKEGGKEAVEVRLSWWCGAHTSHVPSNITPYG